MKNHNSCESAAWSQPHAGKHTFLEYGPACSKMRCALSFAFTNWACASQMQDGRDCRKVSCTIYSMPTPPLATSQLVLCSAWGTSVDLKDRLQLNTIKSRTPALPWLHSHSCLGPLLVIKCRNKKTTLPIFNHPVFKCKSSNGGTNHICNDVCPCFCYAVK